MVSQVYTLTHTQRKSNNLCLLSLCSCLCVRCTHLRVCSLASLRGRVNTVRRSVCSPVPLPARDDEVTGPSLLTSQFNLDLHNPGVNFHRVHPSAVSRQVTGVRQLSHVPLLHQQTGASKHAGEDGERKKHLIKSS